MSGNKKIFAYSRIEMLLLRNSEESKLRPSFLPKEFDTDGGLFSPDKWLQNLWKTEGKQLEQQPKKKPILGNKIIANAGRNDDATVLSPQRRAFSSGCKAPTTNIDDDKSKPKWRTTQGSNHINFKPDFQRTRHGNKEKEGNRSGWSRNDEPSRSSAHEKARRYKEFENKKDDDEAPEWLDDGPSSVNDMIELKGFDDDMEQIRRQKAEMAAAADTSFTDESVKNQSTEDKNIEKVECSVSRSSRQSSTSDKKANENGVTETGDSHVQQQIDVMKKLEVFSPNEKEENAAKEGQQPPEKFEQDDIDDLLTRLPTSDADFAALLGISLDQLNPISSEEETDIQNAQQAPSSSRLIQFFSNPAQQTSTTSTETNPSKSMASAADNLQPKVRPIVGQSYDDILFSGIGASQFNRNQQEPEMLQKLFNNPRVSSEQQIPRMGSNSPTIGPSLKGLDIAKTCYTLEEIERPISGNAHNNFSSSTGNLSNMPLSMEQQREMDSYFQQIKLDQRPLHPQTTRPGSANIFSELLPPNGRPVTSRMSRDDPRGFIPPHPQQLMTGGPSRLGNYQSPSRHPLYGERSRPLVGGHQMDPEIFRRQFNHQLLLRARMLQANPHTPVEFPALRSAFFQMMQDPSMRALIDAAGGFSPQHNHQNQNQMPSANPHFSPHHHHLMHNTSPVFDESSPLSHHRHGQMGPLNMGPPPRPPPNNLPPPHHLFNPRHHGGPMPPHPPLHPSMMPHQQPPTTFNHSNTGAAPPRLSSNNMMPTSVMRRQITKVPILGASHSSGSERYEGARNQKPPPLLQHLFSHSQLRSNNENSSGSSGEQFPNSGSPDMARSGLRLEEIERELFFSSSHTHH